MALTSSDFSIEALRDAAKQLEESLTAPKDKENREAAISRFEHAFDLSWRMLRRHLEAKTQQKQPNVRTVFQEAEKLGLIGSATAWLSFLETPDPTADDYTDQDAETVYETAMKFSKEINGLLTALEKT